MIQLSRYHILLITPEQEWSRLLDAQLAPHGFAPLIIAPTGASALTLLQGAAPQLTLIDQGISDYPVVDLCTAIHLAQPTVKILLITERSADAPPAALTAVIAGCIGRNLPLPAWPALLIYILEGGLILGQQGVATALLEGRATQKRQPTLSIGALSIDLSQRLVLYAGQRILLTAREFTLLAYLASNPDHTVTIDQILSDAWGYDSDNGTPAQVRLYITRLRRKLLANPQMPDFIRTVRGIGYRLDSAVLG